MDILLGFCSRALKSWSCDSKGADLIITRADCSAAGYVRPFFFTVSDLTQQEPKLPFVGQPNPELQRVSGVEKVMLLVAALGFIVLIGALLL
ncbi:hypothetical protein NB311A_20461 [Nitrobacter sp. Nb-311A]|uniref:hypothetical protein n=1 Tax=Nitrobacter sp. Nb-311A TaxID=314253 RepID=UPI0000687A7C|nr:hypothetical protein [Nitrobacter sp. Nb-311A]EAQ36348.1 hypothetical protein NB311A_20461 [Nitrobacter sp. Nb-311A]